MSQSVGIRLPDALKDELDSYSARNGITRNAVVQAAIEGISRGDYEIRDGRFEPTEEYLDAVRPIDNAPTTNDSEYYEFGFDTFVRLLRKKDCPDDYIKRLVSNMIETAYDMPKYNPRRARDEWA